MLNGGILETNPKIIQDIKVTADGSMCVSQRGDSGDLVTDSYVLFADGAAINTESLLTLTTPTALQPDALYAVTIHNPSNVTDLTIEALNLCTMITRNYPAGEVKSGSLVTWTVPKTAGGLRDTYTKIVQGLFLGDSSKISVKNATALTATQSQTITLGAAANDGTWKIGLIHAITGLTTHTTALNHDISNASLKTAIDALIAACGYTKSTDASAITSTISGGVLPGTPAVATLSASGTTIIPLIVGVNIDLDGSVLPVITQTTVGVIMKPRLQGNINGTSYDEWFDDMETATARFNELSAIEAITGCVILELCGHKTGESCVLIQKMDIPKKGEKLNE